MPSAAKAADVCLYRVVATVGVLNLDGDRTGHR